MLVKTFKSKPDMSNKYINQGSFSLVNVLHHWFQHLKRNTESWGFHQFETSTAVQHAATILTSNFHRSSKLFEIYGIKSSSSISPKVTPIL